MSETATVTPPSPATTDPAERGTLRIDRSVPRKIAEHAADRVRGCVRVGRRTPAGVGYGGEGTTARLFGADRELRIRLHVPLSYPAPVHQTVCAVRERVTRELEELVGCRVRTIDVTVWALVSGGKPRRVE